VVASRCFPHVTETTAIGAAYLAGLAGGFWRSPAEIARQWQAARRFEASMPAAETGRLRSRWRAALDRSRRWLSP